MNFNPIEDAKVLNKAMKGAGTDEETIIKISTERSVKQRLAIREAYQNLYGKELIDEFKSELSGKFYDAIEAMYTDPIVYECQQYRKAMKGLGCDDDTLLELVATRPYWLIKQIISKYPNVIKRDLLSDIENETSGQLKKLLMSLLKGERSENQIPNKAECEQWVNSLIQEGEKKWEKDSESIFWRMLMKKSPAEILMIARMFYKKRGVTLLETIENEFSKKGKNIASNYLIAILSPSEYFAKRLNNAIKGIGTNDTQLIRVLVTRDEIDMALVRAYYKQIFGEDMLKEIKGDTSGDYRKLLMTIASH